MTQYQKNEINYLNCKLEKNIIFICLLRKLKKNL